jgi:RNA polymerase II C-terminal domain phosphatase-like 3/4
MYVSTLSRRAYAEPIIRYVDPSGQYFGQRLMCRDDEASLRNDRKSIAVFFPDDSRMVIVLDDSPAVWRREGHKDALMQIEAFHFFNRLHHQPPTLVPGAHRDCVLPRIAEVLLAVHADYFAHDPEYEVFDSLADFRRRVLGGCYLLFVDVWPLDQAAIRDECVGRAEDFGATVLLSLMSYCTHIVTTNLRAEMVQAALEFEGIWIVSRLWFDFSCFQYRRLDERDPAFRVEPAAPARTAGPRQRSEPPSETELNSTDLELALECEEETSTSSVDLTFLDEPTE